MTKGGAIAQNRVGFYVALGVAAFLMVASMALWAQRGDAGSDRYVFLVRGIVTAMDTGNKTVTVSATHASDLATNDLAGQEVVYNIRPANFYKWTNGVKKRVTLTKSAQVGDEVVMRGAAKTNGQYNVSWLVVNQKSFTVIGKLKENNLVTKTVKILVGTSSYKQSSFVDKEVVMHYTNDTKFKALGKDVDNDDVTANNQLVKVSGTIDYGNWNVANFWDGYK
ncbi:MAG: hypothetical protein Q8P73_03920 [bacterium]|nr:hypothetical protein [bacterium]MDZ4345810.1 hypothetical protein [Candidatus Binatia bacterium]